MQTMDQSWSAKWAKLEADISILKDSQLQGLQDLRSEHQNAWTKFNTDLDDFKEERGLAAQHAQEEANYVRDSLQTLGSNQQVIAREQKAHSRALHELKEGALVEVQAKLEASLEAARKLQAQAPRAQAIQANSYAEKAARPARRQDAEPQPPQDYLDMARRKPTPRPTSSVTNGGLSRVYIKYWRKQPVGLVKRALRKAVSVWSNQTVMDDGEMDKEEAILDIDAVRHLNQFGTPEQPIMEVACTPERAATVVNFF